MQVAYAADMTEENPNEASEAAESPRRARRKVKLIALLAEIGGPVVAEADTKTPRTHFIAMAKGRRGLGDTLAAKLEAKYGKPRGWFDAPDMPMTGWPFSIELRAEVQKLDAPTLALMETSMWTFLRKTAPQDLHFVEERPSEHAEPTTVTVVNSNPRGDVGNSRHKTNG